MSSVIVFNFLCALCGYSLNMNYSLKNLKIRYKIFLPTAGFIVIMTSIISILVAKVEKITIIDEAEKRSGGLCEVIGYASVKSLLENNLLELQGMVETIYRINDVNEVVIANPQGKILVSSNPDKINGNWEVFNSLSFSDSSDQYNHLYFIINENGKEITTVIPILSLEATLGYAGVSLSLVPVLNRIKEIQKIILITGISILLFSLILLYYLSRQISKPIQDLTLLAKEYSKGNLLLRSSYIGNDEAGELAKEFNKMAANILNLENELVHREKLSALGTTASAIAHELKTPLTSLTNFLSKLPEKRQDENFLRMFQEITLLELKRLNKLVDDLLTFSRKESIQPQSISLRNACQEVLTLLKDEIAKKQIEISVDIKFEEKINVDPLKFHRVLVNLIDNAIKAIENHGIIAIKAFSIPGEANKICIEISDNGCGIPLGLREKIFEPFFTTRARGTGLGLAICKNIISMHNGSLEVKDQKNEGTTFSITLPT